MNKLIWDIMCIMRKQTQRNIAYSFVWVQNGCLFCPFNKEKFSLKNIINARNIEIFYTWEILFYLGGQQKVDGRPVFCKYLLKEHRKINWLIYWLCVYVHLLLIACTYRTLHKDYVQKVCTHVTWLKLLTALNRKRAVEREIGKQSGNKRKDI